MIILHNLYLFSFHSGAAGMNGNGTPPQEVNTHQGATLLNAEEGNGDVTVKQPSPKKRNPASRCKWFIYMGQVTKLRLSCYLVLLSVDSKTR